MTPPMNDVRPTKKPSFLARLRRDARGNTLAIVGAALVPLTAMIGSGVDLSRAYMAKTRLQSACDAASLAGRRAMTNDTMSNTVRTEAIKFFNFNFQQGLYDTAAFTPQVTRPGVGVVKVTASTTIPTVIMDMFGFATLPLRVECDASQNFVNTDIILVLDVTGSMLQDINGNSTSNTANQKITALRDAVLALYDELAPIQTQLQANNMRLRYGIVPYSSGINVGRLLRAANANNVVSDQWNYFSRRPIFEMDSPRVQYNIRKGSCEDRDNWSWQRTSGSGSSALGTCTYTVKQESYDGLANQFKRWEYGQTPHDVSRYVTGASTANPARRPGTTENTTWAGCIEERETVSTITSSSTLEIPSGARDLDIDAIPTNDNRTKWRPYWPEVAYMPNNGNQPQLACPTEARRLQAWTRNDLSTYLTSLTPTGGTYHDNGMIWGTRLISAAGVFADSPDVHNGFKVAKHIIYMTDGVIDTGPTIYSTYGMERWDERVTGGYSTDADQTARHNQRFRMMCNAAKGKNVSVWVIAFASTLTTTLTECASSPSQASVSTNRQQLIAKFTEIGKNIGALRLTQ